MNQFHSEEAKKNMQQRGEDVCPVCGQKIGTSEPEMFAQNDEESRLMPYLELLKEIPELKEAKELPQEVIEMIVKGETPLHAYRAYQNQQMQAQLEAMKRMKNAPGSASGNAVPKKDSFSSGFDEGFLY